MGRENIRAGNSSKLPKGEGETGGFTTENLAAGKGVDKASEALGSSENQNLHGCSQRFPKGEMLFTEQVYALP